MRLEHVGIAVSNIEDALKTFEALLGTSRYKTEQVESENVVTHFLWADGVKIELLESTDPESAVSRFLEKRGDGIHHLAFHVDDLDLARNKLSSMGFQVIGREAKSGADGKRIFFVHPKDVVGVLIECCTNESLSARPDNRTTIAPNVTMRTFGSDVNPCLIIAASPESSPVSTVQLALRLEPVAFVKLIDCVDNADVTSDVAETVNRFVAEHSSRWITTGATALRLFRAALDLGSTPESWVHIERSGEDTGSPALPTIPGPHLLIQVGAYSKPHSWPTAILPAFAVSPDEPGSDALIPLIRSCWKS